MNPLDYLLRRIQPQFESTIKIKLVLDGLFFGGFMLYAFITTLYGVSKIGIDFIPGNQHQKIRRRDTYPQAMSVVVVLVTTMMFSFSMQIMQFAP